MFLSETEINELDEIQLQIILNNSLKSLFGEIGQAGLNPKILRYDSNSKMLIIETTEKNIERLRQALCLTGGLVESPDIKINKLFFKILNVSKYLSNIDVNSRNDFF